MLKDLYTDIVKSTLEQIAPTTDASSQKLLTDINSATDNKQAKRLITEYLEIHHKELEKTKSFASHLVKILIKNDENHKRKWKCYDAYPIKLYTGIAYHGTKVTTKTIFSEGLKANRLPNGNIEDYVSILTGGIGVSTSKSIAVACHYATPTPKGVNNSWDFQDYSSPGYIYIVDYQGDQGVDICATMRKRGKYGGNKFEVNIAENIPSKNIVGAIKLSNTGEIKQIIQNENYNGEKNNIELLNDAKQRLNGNFQHKIPDKNVEQTFMYNSIEINDRIDRIKQKIEQKTINKKWYLGRGASNCKITINDQNYSVPQGIKLIYDIVNINKKYDVNTLKTIRGIARSKTQQSYTFLFFGRRSSDTQNFYKKIIHLIDDKNVVEPLSQQQPVILK